MSIKHFDHFLEGKQFAIFTDHKPVKFAINSHNTHYSPRVSRQLSIAEFTQDLRHKEGKNNAVADSLSHNFLNSMNLKSTISITDLALAQRDYYETQ